MNNCGNCQECCVDIGYAVKNTFTGVSLDPIDCIKLYSKFFESGNVKKTKFGSYILSRDGISFAKIWHTFFSYHFVDGALFHVCNMLNSDGCLLHNDTVSNPEVHDFLNKYSLSDSLKPSACRFFPNYVFRNGYWLKNNPSNECSVSLQPVSESLSKEAHDYNTVLYLLEMLDGKKELFDLLVKGSFDELMSSLNQGLTKYPISEVPVEYLYPHRA